MAPAVQNFDITPKLSPFLNEHSLVEVLQFLQQKNSSDTPTEQQFYPPAQIQSELVSLLENRTNLVDILNTVNPTADYADRQRACTAKTDALSKKVKNLLLVLEEGKLQELLQNCNNYAQTSDKYNVGRAEIDGPEGLYDWSLASFDYGLYARAAEGLAAYIDLVKKIVLSERDGENVGKNPRYNLLNLKFGLLAAYIGDKNYEQATSVVHQIEEFLEHCATSNTSQQNSALPSTVNPAILSNNQPLLSKSEVLTHRCWLMHWSLFILFKASPGQSHQVVGHEMANPRGSQVKIDNTLVSPKVWEKLVDLFVSEPYLLLVSLQAPHLLRYISALFLRERRLKSFVKDLTHVLGQDVEAYKDPVTEFLLSLHQDLDFDVAAEKLKEVMVLVKQDYFLSGNSEVIVSNARLAIFGIYCRTHQSVDITTLAKIISLPPDDCEAYIASLIQQGRLNNACISTSGTSNSVSFEKKKGDLASLVLEKTKNMSFRLRLLQANASVTASDKKDSAKLGALTADLAGFLA